jgi:chromosome segregation protein
VKLKSLELHGFKSFVDKTALVFEPGVTAVVGPNGCGKSNVVDAMRWVMGEQSARRLRGKGMEDVIFQGSEGRSPVGMAEVVLTFDNSGGDGPPAFSSYSEIQITRRLYRTGESEYLLNRTPCRMRDVHDFFRDTGIGTKGYTIVEQGRIAEIISAKAEERRTLIEEAAGIGKYKARRREAESKIGSTEQNLLRITDVLAEIRRQINSIDRQAKKAARYKRLRETLRVLELSIAADERRARQAESETAKLRLAELGEEVANLDAALAQRELAVQANRLELAESERVLSHGNESLLALRTDIKHHEGQIEFGRRERESLAETIAARGGELERLEEQLRLQEVDDASATDELRSIESATASEAELLAASERAVTEAREQLQEIEREREVANGALVEALTGIARSEDRLSTIDDRRAEIAGRIRTSDDVMEVGQTESSRADNEQREIEEGLRNLLAERDRFMGLVRRAIEAHEEAVVRGREAAEKLREIREQRETRKARLDSLREIVERRDDVGEGARHLLSAEGSQGPTLEFRGLVRDLLEVDREVEFAVEAILAERAEAIVVDAPATAIAAVERLRADRAGRGVLVSLSGNEPDAAGFVPLGQPLLERVRARAGFEGLARTLLGGVNLVGDLREVLSVYDAGRLPATFVTPEGDVLATDGTVRGGVGAEGPAQGLLARVGEVRELTVEVAGLDRQVIDAESANQAAEEQLARAADELDNLRNRHHTAALAVANHEKDLERTRERIKALGEAHEGRTAERSEILAEIELLTGEHARLERSLEDVRGDRAKRQRELDALALRAGSSGRELNRLETIATERRVEHAGRSEKCDRLRLICERAVAAVAETREWIERRNGEIVAAETRREELAEKIGSSENALETQLREEEAARAGNDAKRDAYEQVSAEVARLDEGVRELRSEIANRHGRVNDAELKSRELELTLAHLEDSIREKWDVEIASWRPPSVEPEEPVIASPGAEESSAAPSESDESETASLESETESAGDGTETESAGDGEEESVAPNAARDARENALLATRPVEERKERLEDVRRKIQSLGEVNLGAIEEQEELSERSRFLSEQKDDLERTLTSLRDAIQRINRTSRRRFKDTFEEVSKRFSENFPRLFNGGRASLSLTDAEDVLESGIDIMAMPPGKRLQNVNLLSGGEKTLTAIALLISVFQVRPSPFFLLDEVDAALDDANVGRFNDLVREMAAWSQFVVITHNKRTIEVADVLYGVTMERKGVSKLVSVELH